jgi:hypothetical protein
MLPRAVGSSAYKVILDILTIYFGLLASKNLLEGDSIILRTWITALPHNPAPH